MMRRDLTTMLFLKGISDNESKKYPTCTLPVPAI